MASPAFPVFIDPGHGFGVAAHAVFFDDSGIMVGNFNDLGHLSGVIADDIVDAVDGFPVQVPGKIVVGEVAVDAGDAFVGPGMEPGFVFHL